GCMAWLGSGTGGSRAGMKIVRFAAPDGAQGGYLDGEALVPVGAGEGRTGLDAVLDLAMAANADPGLRPTPVSEPQPLASARLLAPVADPPRGGDLSPC